ncbi:MAG TPA: hypothetical protein VGL81_26885 [Polyangiaceae bacterium]|jgi:hypothetical protein
MLRARICDPAGPRWWRIAATVGTLPLTALAVGLPGSVTARAMTMLLGLAWLTLGRLVVPRLPPRSCSIELEPGAIRVRNAGLSSQRIAAADVRAASTAELSDGRCAVALVRQEEGDPVWLELEKQGDLDGVRRALGIGHTGFGALRWPSARGGFHNTPTAADGVVTLGWLAMLVAVWMGAAEVALAIALPVLPLTLVAMVLATTTRPWRHGIALSPRGVQTVLHGCTELLPWEKVVDAKVVGTELSIETADGAKAIPMRSALPAVREHLAAQLRSAIRRSRGEGPPPPEPPASLAILSRRDEGRRAWLERLDATAASMAQGEGYRLASVEPRDLWTTLDSPDAPPSLRAAAARILARVAPQEAGERIAKTLAREHDRETRQCIRVALEEDVEVAARELDRLDRS